MYDKDWQCDKAFSRWSEQQQMQHRLYELNLLEVLCNNCSHLTIFYFMFVLFSQKTPLTSSSTILCHGFAYVKSYDRDLHSKDIVCW